MAQKTVGQLGGAAIMMARNPKMDASLVAATRPSTIPLVENGKDVDGNPTEFSHNGQFASKDYYGGDLNGMHPGGKTSRSVSVDDDDHQADDDSGSSCPSTPELKPKQSSKNEKHSGRLTVSQNLQSLVPRPKQQCLQLPTSMALVDSGAKDLSNGNSFRDSEILRETLFQKDALDQRANLERVIDDRCCGSTPQNGETNSFNSSGYPDDYRTVVNGANCNRPCKNTGSFVPRSIPDSLEARNASVDSCVDDSILTDSKSPVILRVPLTIGPSTAVEFWNNTDPSPVVTGNLYIPSGNLSISLEGTTKRSYLQDKGSVFSRNILEREVCAVENGPDRETSHVHTDVDICGESIVGTNFCRTVFSLNLDSDSVYRVHPRETGVHSPAETEQAVGINNHDHFSPRTDIFDFIDLTECRSRTFVDLRCKPCMRRENSNSSLLSQTSIWVLSDDVQLYQPRHLTDNSAQDTKNKTTVGVTSDRGLTLRRGVNVGKTSYAERNENASYRNSATALSTVSAAENLSPVDGSSTKTTRISLSPEGEEENIEELHSKRNSTSSAFGHNNTISALAFWNLISIKVWESAAQATLVKYSCIQCI